MSRRRSRRERICKHVTTSSNIASSSSTYFHANVDAILEHILGPIVIEVLIKAVLAKGTKRFPWVLCCRILEMPRLHVNHDIGELFDDTYRQGNLDILCLYAAMAVSFPSSPSFQNLELGVINFEGARHMGHFLVLEELARSPDLFAGSRH